MFVCVCVCVCWTRLRCCVLRWLASKCTHDGDSFMLVVDAPCVRHVIPCTHCMCFNACVQRDKAVYYLKAAAERLLTSLNETQLQELRDIEVRKM